MPRPTSISSTGRGSPPCSRGCAIATVGRVATGELDTNGDRDGVVRWTILALRWPRLAAHMMENPEQLRKLVPSAGDTGDGDVPVELLALRRDPALAKLPGERTGETKVGFVDWVVTEFGSHAAASDAHQ